MLARLHRQPDERRDRGAAIFLGYQQLENHVIQPTVIGRAVHLTPPTTMLAAVIGGAAAGVPGALVATPLVGAAKSVWLDVVAVDTRDETVAPRRRDHVRVALSETRFSEILTQTWIGQDSADGRRSTRIPEGRHRTHDAPTRRVISAWTRPTSSVRRAVSSLSTPPV